MARRTRSMFDLMMEHEGGSLSGGEELRLFSHLVKTGQAWSLQGHYGRTAASYIEGGLLTREGKVTKAGREWASGIEVM